MSPPKGSGPAKKRAARSTRKRKHARAEGTTEILIRLLAAPYPIKLDGEAKKVRTIQAITLKLIQKAFAGDPAAERALSKYEQYCKRRQAGKVTLQYVDNEYTRGVARRLKGGDHG